MFAGDAAGGACTSISYANRFSATLSVTAVSSVISLTSPYVRTIKYLC